MIQFMDFIEEIEEKKVILGNIDDIVSRGDE